MLTMIGGAVVGVSIIAEVVFSPEIAKRNKPMINN